ncbi:TPA: hypothetical protein RQN23_002920 [Aeromonas veronii]|nr:hypothetical protein [Aeromonas veronii]
MSNPTNEELIQQSLIKREQLAANKLNMLSHANSSVAQKMAGWMGQYSTVTYKDAHHVGRIILATDGNEDSKLHDKVHVSKRIGERPKEAFQSVLSDGVLNRLDDVSAEIKELRKGLGTNYEAMFFYHLKQLQPDCYLLQHVTHELNSGKSFQEIFSNPNLSTIQESTKNEIRHSLEVMSNYLNDHLARDILHSTKADPIVVLMERAALRSSIEQTIKTTGMNLAPPGKSHKP